MELFKQLKITAGTGWTMVSDTFTAPAGAVTCQPWVQIDATDTAITAGNYYGLVAAPLWAPLVCGTFILPMPTSPAPRQIDFEVNEHVGVTQSPFTLQTQTQVWPGADWWTASISMPSMQNTKADAWVAWLMSLRGMQYAFLLGDRSGKAPNGRPTGTPVVDGSVTTNNLPTSQVLYTRGWSPYSLNNLRPGDYIQLGYRLYTVLTPVNADLNGKAAVSIWPSLREQPADGQRIFTTNTQGVFRLADNKRDWTIHAEKIVNIAFKGIEAR